MPPVTPVLPAPSAPVSGAVTSALPATSAPAGGAVTPALPGSGPPAAGTVTSVTPASGVSASGTVNPVMSPTSVAPGGAVTPVPPGPAAVTPPAPSDAVRTSPQDLTGKQASTARKNLNLWAYSYPLLVNADPLFISYSDGRMAVFEITNPDGTRYRVDFVNSSGNYVGSVTRSDTRLSDDNQDHAASLTFGDGEWTLETHNLTVSAAGGFNDFMESLPWPETVAAWSPIADAGQMIFFEGLDGTAMWFDPSLSRWNRVGPDDSDLVHKTGAETVGGVKTFSGQVEGTGQTSATANSMINRKLLLAQLLGPAIRQHIPSAGSAINGATSTVTTNSAIQLLANARSAAYATATLCLNVHTFAGATGNPINYSKPLLVRVPLLLSPFSVGIDTGKIRIYIGAPHSNFAVPFADQDPVPAYYRMWGAEIRRKTPTDATKHEARLFARNAWLTIVYAGQSTSGSAVITGMSAAQVTEIQAQMAAGDSVRITGTGIPANATVVSVNSATQITLSDVATATTNFGASGGISSQFPGTLVTSAWTDIGDANITTSDRFHDLILGHGGTSGKIGIWCSSWGLVENAPLVRPDAPLLTLASGLTGFKPAITFSGGIIGALAMHSTTIMTGQALFQPITTIESKEPIGSYLD